MPNRPIAESEREPAAMASGASARHEVAPDSARGWRESVATALYHGGIVRAMQGISRYLEADADSRSRWPRLRRASSPKYVILCYHRVGTGGVPLYSELPQSVFEAQMRFLWKRHRIVSLQEVVNGLENGDNAGPGVAVTFDDGYQGVFTEAFPVLRDYQIPATVFLTAESIETGRVAWYDRIFLILQVLPAGRLDLEFDGPRSFDLSSPQTRLQAATEIMHALRALPDSRRKERCADLERRVQLDESQLTGRMLNWGQVKIMQQAGISFGSHTMTHPVVGRLTTSEMEEELTASKRCLEAKLDCPVLDFAFPFGQFSDCGLDVSSGVLARCGYRSSVTTVPGVNTTVIDRFALRRVQLGEEHNLAMFAFRLSQLLLSAGRLGPAGDPKEASPVLPGSPAQANESSSLGVT